MPWTRKRARLADALVGCDVFLGLSAKGAVTPDMVRTMANAPIIFAMANPDPEITPEEASAVRPDAIVATGRSRLSKPGQQCAGLSLYLPRCARCARPHHQRGDEDRRRRSAGRHSRARMCPMKSPPPIAAGVPPYGPEYIIPAPFDPRLISRVSSAVAEAAIRSGVARRADERRGRLSRPAFRRGSIRPRSCSRRVTASVRANPKRVAFAEGEEESVIRAAAAFQNAGLGKALLHRPRRHHPERLRNARPRRRHQLEIRVPHSAKEAQPYIDALYRRLQRRGALYRDCVRMVTNDRNVYAASMLAAGDADAHRHRCDAQLCQCAQRRAPRARHAARPAPHRRDGDLLQGPRRFRRPTPMCTRCRPPRNLPTSRSRPQASPSASAIRRAWRCWPRPPSASRRPNARAPRRSGADARRARSRFRI